MLAMDKALKRLSKYMKKAGMWKNTIFIFSTGRLSLFTTNRLCKRLLVIGAAY